MDYNKFLTDKTRKPKPMGFAPPKHINDVLFDWQIKAVKWALQRGRSALFEECGLGKTGQQLAWAEHVHKHTGEAVIIHCPVGIRQQTKAEAEKFGIEAPVAVVDDGCDTINGINLVNYEKLHKFDTTIFAGVVLDESSILKNFTGKTKRQILAAYESTPYKLACTATPAPNDLMELGNHADFLGVMPSNEMLSRWFINDTMKAGGYRLKQHAAEDFWDWVATWAICLETPSDIGGDDKGFNLPPMLTHEHIITVTTDAPEGMLFDVSGLSATTVHKDKRATCRERAAFVADLVASNSEEWIVWCDTNYEADELKKAIPEAVEVRGSDSIKLKEDRLHGFGRGDFRVIISKPEIAGLGMNWQHCPNMAFVGLSYSFERTYQAIRRIYRFGQQRTVNVHLVSTDSEQSLAKAQERKTKQFTAMRRGMAEAMRRATSMQLQPELQRDRTESGNKTIIPDFLKRG